MVVHVLASSQSILLNTLQQWLGHADLKTAAIYADAQGEEDQASSSRMWYRMHELPEGRMGMQDTDLDTLVEPMQQVLERDYAYLEWRVLVQADAERGPSAEPWLVVHARTRDFRYGCRIGRSRTAVLQAPTLRFLIADLVAEVERRLAERAASAS